MCIDILYRFFIYGLARNTTEMLGRGRMTKKDQIREISQITHVFRYLFLEKRSFLREFLIFGRF
jgi:hypothetical protein